MPDTKKMASLRTTVGLNHAVIDSATTTEQTVSEPGGDLKGGFVRSLLINEKLSHTCAINIDGSLFHTIPANTPPGPYPLYDAEYNASLKVDFDDSVTTGNFAIIYFEY